MKSCSFLFLLVCLFAFQNDLASVHVVALSSNVDDNSLSSSLLQPTADPPLLNSPTFSLATCDENTGQTGMNILTYATPISIRPDRIWSLGLFKGTWTHEQFAKSGVGILQLLTPQHAQVVKLLGGSSTREVNKQQECAALGMSWIPFSHQADEESSSSSIQVLPGCRHYLKVRLVGDLIDCGSHDLAMCKVESMFVAYDNDDNDCDKEVLMTAQLREMGIITAQGRVAED